MGMGVVGEKLYLVGGWAADRSVMASVVVWSDTTTAP
jgi:hypothetical protein